MGGRRNLPLTAGNEDVQFGGKTGCRSEMYRELSPCALKHLYRISTLLFFCDINETLATGKLIFSDKNRFLYLVHKAAGGVYPSLRFERHQK